MFPKLPHQEIMHRNDQDHSIPKKNVAYDYTKPTFVFCEGCHWCTTFFKTSEPKELVCSGCMSKELSSFPIMSDESFTFGYDEKKGLELDFRKKKRNH